MDQGRRRFLGEQDISELFSDHLSDVPSESIDSDSDIGSEKNILWPHLSQQLKSDILEVQISLLLFQDIPELVQLSDGLSDDG
jgi:hypothetical protein